MSETTPENVGQATEPTLVEVPHQEPAATEIPQTPNAPGFLAVVPYMGAPAVAIYWQPPVEGPADSYTVECNGQSIDVGGDVLRVDMGGLQPGQEVTATVTAKTGKKTGSLSCGPAQVDPTAPADQIQGA